jgi:hypothetical protein
MATHEFLKGTPEDALRSKKRSRNFFYLEGKLYRKIRVLRGQDIMMAWSYEDEATVKLPYSYVQKKRRPTFTPTQAAQMLGRNRLHINRLYSWGVVPKPKQATPMGNPTSPQARYRLSEDDVYALHQYFATSIHAKKYDTSAGPLPTRRELAAMMKYEKITYVMTPDGEFVPNWKAPDIEEWL